MGETIRIPWTDGVGNIIVSLIESAGYTTVVNISTDSNSGIERSQVLTVRTKGGATKQISVSQKGSRVILRDKNGLVLQDSESKILTAKIK